MHRLLVVAMATPLSLAVPAHAQTPAAAAQAPPEQRWSVEASIGWDNGISGNILASGIGTLAELPAVIEERSYDDVYGTGVQFRVGAGYMLDARQEVRGALTIQNVSADAVEIGTLGGSPLFATFDDYSSYAIDAGYRYYFGDLSKRVRPYGGATLGVAIIDNIDASFAAPSVNATLEQTDFYDHTASLAIGFEGGAMILVAEQVDINLNLGFRYTGGLSEIEGLQGTGLEDINDDTGRWTLPFMVGVRVKF